MSAETITLVHDDGRVWATADSGGNYHAFRIDENGQPVALCRRNVVARWHAQTYDSYVSAEFAAERRHDRCLAKLEALEAEAREQAAKEAGVPSGPAPVEAPEPATHTRTENGVTRYVSQREALDEINHAMMGGRRYVRTMSTSDSRAHIVYRDGRDVRIEPVAPRVEARR